MLDVLCRSRLGADACNFLMRYRESTGRYCVTKKEVGGAAQPSWFDGTYEVICLAGVLAMVIRIL